MGNIIKLGLILLLICAIAAVFLGLTYEVTIDQIIFQRNAINEQARKDVLPAAEKFEAIDEKLMNEVITSNDNIKEIYAGYKAGEIVGFAIKSVSQGYGGDVEVITGINSDGIISGVRVGNHLETPGLGANATNPSFYTQFDNKKTDKELKVVKAPPQEDEIQALSGATITSKAVTDAVNDSIDAFKLVKGQ
ncbi:MAG: RnfABCDGE type electron transport complex subunit G [Bacillota bacterium]